MNIELGIENLKYFADQNFEIWNNLQSRVWYMESGIHNPTYLAD